MTGQSPSSVETGPPSELYQEFCDRRGLRWPAGVSRLLRGPVGSRLKRLIYWPDGNPDEPNSLEFGLKLLEGAIRIPPSNLVPLLPVDDRSIACAVCVRKSDWDDEHPDDTGPAPCEVVRWHLGFVQDRYQGALLDTDAYSYLQSFADELLYRPGAISRMRDQAKRYQTQYVAKERLPRKHIQRPVQLACQNVIVGLATLQQDATFDGLRVEDFVTCEVPHLATHEANRALVAVMLCDAFQSGGTMEVRFGPQGRERPMPASLQRFARTQGLKLGEEDECAITPAEARKLFFAVTPMPEELRMRCAVAIDRGIVAPERLCFTLMSGTWGAVELAYALATSPRIESILKGGVEFGRRTLRLAELETCRAALMAGMLFRRISSKDNAAGKPDSVRVFEDSTTQHEFSVFDEEGAVALTGFSGAVPWWSARTSSPVLDASMPLIVVPRGLPTPDDLRLVEKLKDRHAESLVALLTPADSATFLPDNIPIMCCPDRVSELDAKIERRSLALKIGRA